jgi:hypothetical protein
MIMPATAEDGVFPFVCEELLLMGCEQPVWLIKVNLTRTSLSQSTYIYFFIVMIPYVDEKTPVPF